MDYVTWAGIVFGGSLILAAIYIAVKKGDFPKGAFVFLGFGLVLISLSKWAVIKVTTDSIQLLRDQVQATAAAAGEVTAQTQQAAAAVQTTQTEVANLAAQLERKQVLPPDVTHLIRLQLNSTPRFDPAKLNTATAELAHVYKA
jgi:hypothetical protein